MAKALISGAYGFIGSCYVRDLLDNTDYEIVNVDKMTYAANLDNLKSYTSNKRYKFYLCDVADYEMLQKIFELERPNYVVHFACNSHVDRSILDPNEFVMSNVVGVNALCLCIKNTESVQRACIVGTDEVYGQIPEGHFSREVDRLEPRSPYSASKASGDLIALSYFTTYGTPVIITRGCNTFGPHQHIEKLIPLFITNLIDGQKVPVYGDGLQKREWVYVEDHVAAINYALKHGTVGEIYNIGTGEIKPNLEVTYKLLELLGRNKSYIKHVKDRLGHDNRYALDCNKLRSLGWKPEYTFDDALKQTVKWYKDNEQYWRKIKRGLTSYFKKQYGGL